MLLSRPTGWAQELSLHCTPQQRTPHPSPLAKLTPHGELPIKDADSMFSHSTDAGGQQLIVELEMLASSKVDAQALAKSYRQGLGRNQATVSYTESTGRILLYRWCEGAPAACSSTKPVVRSTLDAAK